MFYLSPSRLSQEREPGPVQYRKPRSVSTAVTTQGHQTTPLRISKSHDDLLSPFKLDNGPTASGLADPASSIVVTDTSRTEPPSSTKKNNTLPKSYRSQPPSLLDLKGHHSSSGGVHSASSEGSSHLLSPDSIPEGRGVVMVSPGFKRKFSRGHKKASSLGTK